MDAPQKSESPVTSGPIAEEAKTDSAAIESNHGDGGNTAKSLATLKARFALAGHAVYEIAEGGFLVVRPAWNGIRHCRDLYELRSFARMVGVQPA